MFFLESTTASGNTQAGFGGTSIITIVMIVAMVALFYFFMYRPQKKQEKETNNMRNNLAVGDEITTIGGIIGKVVSIKEETVTIETGREKARIRILRSAVRSVDVKADQARINKSVAEDKAKNDSKNQKKPKAEEKAPEESSEETK